MSTPPSLNTFSQFAPLLIQQYESYLPNAFDDSLTLLQKVNKVINSLNTLGTNFNSVVDQWNEAISWVEGDGLTDSVNNLLNQWKDDGTIESLINTDILGKKATMTVNGSQPTSPDTNTFWINNNQIEHYNGSSWDNINPITTASNVTTSNGETVDQAVLKNNKRFNMVNYKVTNTNKYSAWPQDKCFQLNGVLYALYNEGTGHSTADILPKFKKSYDQGQTWSDPYTLYKGDGVTPITLGVECWGAGVDSLRFYSVVSCRGANNNVGTTVHYLVYGAHNNGALCDPNKMASVQINISKNGVVPNQFHSFVSFPDGSIGFGYYYTDGEVGIAKTSDLGVTWTTTVLYSSADMLNQINLCEMTLCYDTTNNATVGFLRSEQIGNFQPVFFKSIDNCQTFTTWQTGINVGQTPIPIEKIGTNYYAFYTERFDQCRMYLAVADCQTALSTGWSAFTVYEIGQGFHLTSSGASGVGVGSLVALNNQLHIFYCNENQNGNVDIYDTVYNVSEDTILSIPPVAITTRKFEGERTQINLIANSAQTIPASSTATDTPLDLKVATDLNGEWDSTNKQVVTKQAGIYAISLSINIASVPDGNQSYIEVSINGSKRRVAWSNNGALQPDVLTGSIITYIDQGVPVQFQITSQNATTLNMSNVSTWVNMYRIG